MTTKRHHLYRNFLPVLALLPLAACSGMDKVNEQLIPLAEWRGVEWDSPARAERIEIRHTVSFQIDSTSIDALERDRLAAFLRQSKVGTGDKVYLAAPLSIEGLVDPLDLARLEVIRGELSLLGLKVAEDSGGTSAGRDRIAITVRRAVVMEPDCDADDTFLGARPEPRFGCITAYNLGQMVANPEDLVEGRDLAPADGTKGATSIERYRTDKVKELEQERTSDL